MISRRIRVKIGTVCGVGLGLETFTVSHLYLFVVDVRGVYNKESASDRRDISSSTLLSFDLLSTSYCVTRSCFSGTSVTLFFFYLIVS